MGGEKGEEGGSPGVELALEDKFLLCETEKIPFPSDFMCVRFCRIPLSTAMTQELKAPRVRCSH